MSGTTALNFGDLEELATLLEAAGIRSVSTDPAKLNLPAVWIDLVGVSLDTLAGCTLQLQLLLIVGDTDQTRNLAGLATLFNQLITALEASDLGGPDGDTTAVTVTLPGSAAPMPALSVPFNLHTSQE